MRACAASPCSRRCSPPCPHRRCSARRRPPPPRPRPSRRRAGARAERRSGGARRPHRPVSGRSGRDHPAGIDQSAADRSGRSLPGQAQDRSEGTDRREVGRRGQVAGELSRGRHDDERRPRLDRRARRSRGRRPGRRARGHPGLPPQDAGGRQPEVGSEADGGGREGSDHDRADRSAGDLRAAVQPDHGGGRAAMPAGATTRRPTRCTTTPTRPAPRSPPA